MVVLCCTQINVNIWFFMYIYGLLYADGKKGTNYFNDEAYSNNFLDYMGYYTVFQLSQHLAETLYYFLTMPEDKIMIGHHLVAIFMMISMLYVGGAFGSIYFLCGMVELSNTCNHIRMFTGDFLKDKESVGYKINGFFFWLTFFSCRICVLTYVVFTKLIFSMPGFTSTSLVEGLSTGQICIVRFGQVMFIPFYALNHYWHFLLFRGILAAVGILKKPEKKKQTKGAVQHQE